MSFAVDHTFFVKNMLYSIFKVQQVLLFVSVHSRVPRVMYCSQLLNLPFMSVSDIRYQDHSPQYIYREWLVLHYFTSTLHSCMHA